MGMWKMIVHLGKIGSNPALVGGQEEGVCPHPAVYVLCLYGILITGCLCSGLGLIIVGNMVACTVYGLILVGNMVVSNMYG